MQRWRNERWNTPPPPPPQHGEGGSLLLQQLWLSRKKVIYINLSRLTAAITWRCWLSWWTRGRQRNTCALWFVYSLHIPPTPSSGWFLSLNEVCKSYMLITHCCPKKKKGQNNGKQKDSFHPAWWKAIPRVEHLHFSLSSDFKKCRQLCLETLWINVAAIKRWELWVVVWLLSQNL